MSTEPSAIELNTQTNCHSRDGQAGLPRSSGATVPHSWNRRGILQVLATTQGGVLLSEQLPTNTREGKLRRRHTPEKLVKLVTTDVNGLSNAVNAAFGTQWKARHGMTRVLSKSESKKRKDKTHLWNFGCRAVSSKRQATPQRALPCCRCIWWR